MPDASPTPSTLRPGELPVHVAGERREEARSSATCGSSSSTAWCRCAIDQRSGMFTPNSSVSSAAAGAGRRVAPGAERHEQLAVGVEREVAVHHRRDADRAERRRAARRSGARRRRRGRRTRPAGPTRRPRASRSRRRSTNWFSHSWLPTASTVVGSSPIRHALMRVEPSSMPSACARRGRRRRRRRLRALIGVRPRSARRRSGSGRRGGRSRPAGSG